MQSPDDLVICIQCLLVIRTWKCSTTKNPVAFYRYHHKIKLNADLTIDCSKIGCQIKGNSSLKNHNHVTGDIWRMLVKIISYYKAINSIKFQKCVWANWDIICRRNESLQIRNECMPVLKVKLHSKKQEWGSLAWVFSQLQYNYRAMENLFVNSLKSQFTASMENIFRESYGQTIMPCSWNRT